MHENACVHVACAHVFATCNFGHILLPAMAARTRTHVSAQLCSVRGSEVCMCLQSVCHSCSGDSEGQQRGCVSGLPAVAWG